MKHIYVASSWRNLYQPSVVAKLREAGHSVYDFRNPPGATGFSWRSVSGSDPKTWSPGFYRDRVLTDPISKAGFESDMRALSYADATVLVLPCGRSAHLELGWATGAGQQTIVLLPEVDCIDKPELMYLMNSKICLNMAEVLEALR